MMQLVLLIALVPISAFGFCELATMSFVELVTRIGHRRLDWLRIGKQGVIMCIAWHVEWWSCISITPITAELLDQLVKVFTKGELG